MDREAREYLKRLGVIALLIAVLQLLGACTRPQTAPKPVVPQIVISALVENNVSFFYWAVTETAKLEVSFCMLGFVSEKTETVLIQKLFPVWIDSAGVAVLWHRPTTCPDSNVVGVVHFHPPQDSANTWDSCKFSDTDIIAAHWNRYPTTAIVCKMMADTFPQFVLMFRREFDEKYAKIPRDTTTPGPTPAPWKATYRYRRPP